MKVAVVGATGMVGTKMLEILDERNFPVTELLPVASENSVGKTIIWKGKPYQVISIPDAIAQKPDLALFSAGGNTSKQWAPEFANVGTKVIDNSSAWRMDATKKLVVPEINASVLTNDDYIIANPNCSTIQMVLILTPLHQRYTIKRVIVSTYQSVSGTGNKAVNQLMNERNGIEDGEKAYTYPIDLNLIPQIDVFEDDGYTKEEIKMRNETKKIMQDDSILVSATCVRVPIVVAHSESVNIEFEKPIDIDEVRAILKQAPGVDVFDDKQQQLYPMPIIAANKDLSYVGRLRIDDTIKNGLNCFIACDNLRKGAATNAIQIAEYLVTQGFLPKS